MARVFPVFQLLERVTITFDVTPEVHYWVPMGAQLTVPPEERRIMRKTRKVFPMRHDEHAWVHEQLVFDRYIKAAIPEMQAVTYGVNEVSIRLIPSWPEDEEFDFDELFCRAMGASFGAALEIYKGGH